MLPNIIKRSLVRSFIIFVILLLIFDIVLTIFIDGIIGQMHKHVLQIASLLPRSDIRDCGKPAQAFIVHVDSERIDPVKQNVNAHVKLEAVDQVGIANVPLGYQVLVEVHVLVALSQVDAFPLSQVVRLNDERSVTGFRCVELSFELIFFHWQHECLREEVVFIWKNFLHFIQVSTKFAFISHHKDAWELTDSLVGLDFAEDIRSNC